MSPFLPPCTTQNKMHPLKETKTSKKTFLDFPILDTLTDSFSLSLSFSLLCHISAEKTYNLEEQTLNLEIRYCGLML